MRARVSSASSRRNSCRCVGVLAQGEELLELVDEQGGAGGSTRQGGEGLERAGRPG